MAEISADQVKQLRDMTGAGMMDCKRALTESGGDAEKAQGLAAPEGHGQGRGQGRPERQRRIVEAYLHGPGARAPKQGALVEVNCESDFVAKTDDFKTLARELALQVVGAKPRWVHREEVPAEVVERETAISARRSRTSRRTSSKDRRRQARELLQPRSASSTSSGSRTKAEEEGE